MMDYFEKLIGELLRTDATTRRVKETLVSKGYEEQAINLVLPNKKRHVIPAVCRWLEDRRIANALTLRNAYVRISKFKTSQ